MKRVLVITYYWPPTGGAGVQRWLKFVKYLGQFGWEPIVYTPANPESPAIDRSLLNDIPENLEILKRNIREPYTVYKKFVGRKKDDSIKAGFLSEQKHPSLPEKISVWIRGNLFIPDARKYWIKPSVRFLREYLIKNPVDVIVSTGPPHSMHLIAYELNKQTGIPWLADFRDPWTSIDFYKDLMLTKQSDKLHHALEKKVLENATRVVVVSHGMVEDFKQVVDRPYDLITNGYDEDAMFEGSPEPDKKFSIGHIGSLVPARNPELFWKVLHELLQKMPGFSDDLEVKLVGPVDGSVKANLEKYGLRTHCLLIPYLGHKEVSRVQQTTQLLLLIINDTPNASMVVTGKIFEYLKSGRPILCIGPAEGDAAQIIREVDAGLVVEPTDLTGIKNALTDFYRKYKAGSLGSEKRDIDRFSRRNLTSRLAQVLDEMIAQ